ncbi:hypothetical protein BGW38_009048 [Lunasporangiospora selenospora]|uniref:Uncharacterized protein n=1 Tax=Lunasporangiospora selenospora TaxID=979761 RepID=A0A9P6FZM5_9FUNG|nr:hypothetical protein BGW38_009048 [Lunasporangiospora selenospora]
MEQALSLPEIRRIIVLFLRPRDRKTCALVSRAWAESVIPWIWYSVSPSVVCSQKELAVLYKNRAHVRTLHTDRYTERVDYFNWFEKLQVLWLGYISYIEEFQIDFVESWMEYADLIHHNRLSLRRIEVNCSGDEDSVILREALECPLLKYLDLSHISIQERDLMESFINTCTRLITLSLWGVSFVWESQLMFKGQGFTNLAQLKVERVCGPYLDILRACPNLKALTLLRCDSVSVAAFLEVITVHCRQLCVLRYAECGFDDGSDFEKVAMALPPMKQLQGMNSVMGNYIPIPAYSHHFKNLQAIQLEEFYGIGTKSAQTLFSSCPNLRSCVGAILIAEDIGSGLSWVCQELEHLEVHIVVDPEKAQLHSGVCHQLSQLKKLRILSTNMGLWSSRSQPQRTALSLRLGDGLELLASLFRLEYLHVGVFQEAWRAEEVEWMVRTWPNIVSIHCDLNEAEFSIDSAESRMVYADLIHHNQLSLQRIELDCSGDEDSVILRKALECPLLKHLYFSEISIQQRYLMESFIKTCTQLTTISLSSVSFVREGQWMYKGQAFTNLERFKIENVRGPYPDNLRACPNLKVLTLSECDPVSVPAFLEVIMVHCRQLYVIRFCDCGFDNDSNFEKVVVALPPIKQLQGSVIIMSNFYGVRFILVSMKTYKMEQALSLPEIRRTIVLFLRPHDYKACALVSRAWAESVIPWIWYSVKLPTLCSLELLAIFHKYRVFVHTLHVNRQEDQTGFYQWFKNLQVLKLGHLGYNAVSQEYSAGLIHHSQSSLRMIQVNCSGDEGSVVLKAALGCPMLQHLDCSNITIQESDLMESFIRAYTGLTTLCLRSVSFVGETHLMFKGQKFSNLEQIKMDSVEGPYLDFLRACPNLKALSILEVDPVSVETFLEVITVHCRKLCVLRYNDCGFDNDSDYEKVVMTLPPMKQLQGPFENMSEFISRPVYSRHYESLQAIRLEDFLLDDGKSSQVIFNLCPNLRSCIGVHLIAEKIELGSPWVCQRLEHLEAHIIVDPEKTQLHSVVCRQLSQLKELRILGTDLTWLSFGTRCQEGSHPPRLGNGLELLASLSKLEYLYVGLLSEGWHAEEVEWMARAWPNLESIHCDIDEVGSPEKLAVLHKHSAFVRILKFIRQRVLIDVYEWFENLKDLYLGYGVCNAEFQEYSADLIRRSQFSLRRIHFHFSADKDSAVFREAFLCPLLKHLSFNNVAIQEQYLMESFIKTCTRLTTPSLKNVTFEETVHLMFSGQTFINLERVKVENVNGPYLYFLRACPNLKALTISGGTLVSTAAFLEVITIHYRQLCVLRYRVCGFNSDGCFEKVAMALPHMK